MNKKIIALILAVLMFVSMVPQCLAADLSNFKKTASYKPGQFLDVLSKNWFAESVIKAYELGLVKGKTATNFAPGGNMTVAEAITLASRIHSIYNTGSANFTQGNPWYKVYVDYAVKNGIIANGQFANYNAVVTRAQFAKIFAKTLPMAEFAGINNVAIGSLPDVKGNEDFASAVYLLYRAGIITGSDKYGTFKPSSYIQRSEVATIATRIVNKSLRKSFVLEKKPVEVSTANLKYYEKFPEVPDFGAYFGVQPQKVVVKTEINEVKVYAYYYREADIKNANYQEVYESLLTKLGYVKDPGSGEFLTMNGVPETIYDNWRNGGNSQIYMSYDELVEENIVRLTIIYDHV